MSLRIYSGFQIHGLTTLREIQKWASQLRENCTNKALENFSNTILRKSCYIYDSLTLDPLYRNLNISLPEDAINITDNDHCFYYVMSKLFNDIRKQSKSTYRNPTLDYNFEMSILPIENKTLGIGFYEQNFYKNILMSEYNNVSEYRYWNNSDKPDDVSEKEWKEREREWNLALPRNSTPNENGLQVSIVNSRNLIIFFDKNKHLHEEFLPSLQERANMITTDIHRELSIQNFCNDENIEIKDIPVSKIVNIIHEIKNDTQDRQKIYNTVVSNIEPIITLKMLMIGKASNIKYTHNNSIKP